MAQWAVLTGGTLLGAHDRFIRKPSGVWRGRVEAIEPGRIWTFEEPPADPLDGGYISIENDNESDATYRIREVRREGGRTLIDVGNVDFVRGMVDELDYSQGFLYDFEVGRPFRVVRTYEARW